MAIPLFVQAAQDPALIPGIYDMCDQWCMYCPATARCLAFRCNATTAPAAGGNMYQTLAEQLFQGVMFMKQLYQAEGRDTPELDALLADDPRKTATLVEIDDPIERMGRRYMRLSDAYLQSRPDFPFEMKRRDSGPTPFEVVAWYHALIPVKVYRALVSAAEAARGHRERGRDAVFSVKVAVIGMDRSLNALAAIAREDDDPRVELLRAQLRRLLCAVEGRFPAARPFVRPGLDTAPV